MRDMVKFIIRAQKPDGQWQTFEGGITPAPDSPDLLVVVEHDGQVYTDETADFQGAFESVGEIVYFSMWGGME